MDKLSDLPIFPIRISTPFAVGDVYSYLIIDDKNVLVDTGHYGDDALETVQKHIQKHNMKVRDLDEIWLTHGHPDHYGQAMRLAELSGATVFGHPKERANFAANDNSDLFEAFFNKHGIPQALTQQMIDQLDWLQQYQQAIVPQWLSDGDCLSSGAITADVHLTPGHAPGHLSFVTDQDIIFSGDLLLGHISTNALINFDADTGQRNKSLLQYRDSLEWIRGQEGIVLPGHGEQIENIAEVANSHLMEHKKRYQKIQQILKQEPMSLMKLSRRMFPDALKGGAVFLVLSEVLGYLDWGLEDGTIELMEKTMEYRSLN